MTAQVSQSIVTTGTTPSALTPAASDTFTSAQIGPNGAIMRVITTGTATDVGVQDPNLTAQGNAGTVVAVSAPATGVRMIYVPRAAINPATDLVTVTFSGARTGVTYELYRI